MLRSAAKPLQALPAVRDGVIERYDLEARHVAVACGSHEGTPAHAATVAEVVARAGLPLAALRPRGVHPPLAAVATRELALAGRVPTVLEHNCSGNHALMLLRESMLERDPAAYLDPDGPAQADATAAVARACDCEPVIAGDRCGMRAYSVPLRNAALGYLRLSGDRHAGALRRGRPRRGGRHARGARDGGRARGRSTRSRMPCRASSPSAARWACSAAPAPRPAAAGRSRSRTARSRPWRSQRCTCWKRSPVRSGEAFDPWRSRPIRDGNGGTVGSWSSALLL